MITSGLVQKPKSQRPFLKRSELKVGFRPTAVLFDGNLSRQMVVGNPLKIMFLDTAVSKKHNCESYPRKISQFVSIHPQFFESIQVLQYLRLQMQRGHSEDVCRRIKI